MATSKTTNTYNRQNWEDAVGYLSWAKDLTSLMGACVSGFSDFVPDVLRRQPLHTNGKK